MSQSDRFRLKTTPSGRSRKQPIAECPRCGQDADLGGKKLDNGSTVLVFRRHRDDVCADMCPTQGMTPEEAARWVESTRELLGLES